MLRRAILDGDRVVPCDDGAEWAMWFEAADRTIARTVLPSPTGEIEVSTVFLGIDHSLGDGTPRWFETMTFGPPGDEIRRQYATRAEAEAGHGEVVASFRGVT